jgi:hypothetical protein
MSATRRKPSTCAECGTETRGRNKYCDTCRPYATNCAVVAMRKREAKERERVRACVVCGAETRGTAYCATCRPSERSGYGYLQAKRKREGETALQWEQRRRIAEMNARHDYQHRHELVAQRLEYVEP